MKKQFYISLILLSAVAFVGVSCAATTVPAATANYEKAKATLVVDANDFDGAIVYHFTFDKLAGYNEQFISVVKHEWATDEEFYLNGYKAKLSDAIEEIIAPPDNKERYCVMPRDGHWCMGVTCNTGINI